MCAPAVRRIGSGCLAVWPGVMVGAAAWGVGGRWVWPVMWCALSAAGVGYFVACLLVWAGCGCLGRVCWWWWLEYLVVSVAMGGSVEIVPPVVVFVAPCLSGCRRGIAVDVVLRARAAFVLPCLARVVLGPVCLVLGALCLVVVQMTGSGGVGGVWIAWVLVEVERWVL